MKRTYIKNKTRITFPFQHFQKISIIKIISNYHSVFKTNSTISAFVQHNTFFASFSLAPPPFKNSSQVPVSFFSRIEKRFHRVVHNRLFQFRKHENPDGCAHLSVSLLTAIHSDRKTYPTTKVE